MYFKCRSLVDAFTVFGSMVDPTVVSWNCVIMGNVLNGEAGLVLDLYGQMQEQGFKPDAATFVAVLKACISLAGREQGKLVKTKCLALGRTIHSQAAAASSDGELHVFVANGLIDMYAKCGSMTDAWKVFQSMPVRSLVSWNCVIFGFAEAGDGKRALELYRQMQDEGCSPNHVSYIAALKACVALVESLDLQPAEDSKMVKLECLQRVKAIHGQAGRDELQRHRFLANAMVAAYAKCGGFKNAREIFESLGRDRDLVTWNSMILGYAENGDGKEALKLYEQMEDEGCAPDDLTFVAALKACSSLVDEENQDASNANLQERVAAIRRRAAAGGQGLSVFVANTLIDFYARCRLIAESREVFESMRVRSVVSWNCIILGLAENGLGRQALSFYARMRDENFAPDTVTFIAALKACGSLGDMQAGTKIRLEIVSAGLEKDAATANSLVDFYGKCGSMGEALEVFESMEKKSTVSWNALMDGYSRQGDYERVFQLFERMQELRFRPNEATFLVLLNVCCHAGLVDTGKELFEAMASGHAISPGLKHYSAMVDLFGRANRMDEAVRMVKSMRVEPNAVIWMTLLAACCKWKDVCVGEFAFTSAIKVLVSARDGEMYATACVMMSNIYANAGHCLQKRVTLQCIGTKTAYD
ncbi:pentatricopeptide repeat-containing protein At5g16860-like [Selaginella moellendorffii]|uniref:pentatricopeptide repeat-containing protein At5g16860-like n=1 Tax=Selaginella moellendorffii TaxID=88036 RepID=UPI000D1CDD07|nr:pentatricopeptide repeat-containing protein At5g16860-like [Selaginella moellendorffii]|eukprot:XP_024526617.1 pentatricopeptide repeat-containing protein At5g16860-like [Selaginella moellendorffii]